MVSMLLFDSDPSPNPRFLLCSIPMTDLVPANVNGLSPVNDELPMDDSFPANDSLPVTDAEQMEESRIHDP